MKWQLHPGRFWLLLLPLVLFLATTPRWLTPALVREQAGLTLLRACQLRLEALDASPRPYALIPCQEGSADNLLLNSLRIGQRLAQHNIASAQNFYLLGLLKFAAGRQTEAEAALREFQRRSGDPDLAAFWLGWFEWTRESTIPEIWAEIDDLNYFRNVANYNFNRGYISEALSQYEVALVVVHRAEVPAYQRAMWYAEYGDLNMRANRKNTAIVAYQEALKLSPDDETYNYKLAKVLLEERHFQDALAHLDHIQGDLTASPAYWVMRGGALIGMEAISDAESAYKHAVTVGPTNERAWAYSALALFYMQQARPADALSAQRAAVELEPDYPWWRIHLGVLCRQLKQHQCAETELNAALELATDSSSRAQANLELAMLEADRGAFATALTYYEHALKDDENAEGERGRQILIGIAQAYLGLNLQDDARAALSRVYGADDPAAVEQALRELTQRPRE